MLELFMPADPLMALAWRDCLRWASHDQDILDAFLAETGVTGSPLPSGLDRLIDQATGRDEAISKQFLAWFNANIWGGMPTDER